MIAQTLFELECNHLFSHVKKQWIKGFFWRVIFPNKNSSCPKNQKHCKVVNVHSVCLLFQTYTLCPLLLEMYFSLSLFQKASKDMGVLANKCVVYSLRRSRTFERAVQLSALLKCTLYTSLHKWNMSICTLFFIIVALFDTKISLYFGFSNDVIIDVLS